MSNDTKIKEYREAIDAKRAALGSKPKATYVTNMLLQLPDGLKVNLNTLSTEAQCVGNVCTLLSVIDNNKKANKLLGTDVKVKFGDYTVEQWIEDIKLRVKSIQWDGEKKKLTAMDKKLAELRSEDAKTEDAIGDIASDLGL